MFDRIQQRLQDARTLAHLCLESERIANAEGQREPGAEHFVMAALAMADGTARRAFEHLGADPDGFRAAIARQYAEALEAVGLVASPGFDTGASPLATPPARGPYQAKASANALIKLLPDEAALAVPVSPLLGAHVLLAATRAPHSTAVRALQALGVDPHALAATAAAEIRRHADGH